MTHTSHDQNFKNLFLDFPTEALAWLLPQALDEWGSVRHVEFVRQEPRKRKLADAHLALDMPILFTFERQQLLLWLVEFQEDKAKFSIYTLARYTIELIEAYPQAIVVPTVLFTDRREWKKDVLRQLGVKFQNRLFLHFEYVVVKLFDYHARDFYHVPNPVVKILLPKMQYTPEERWEVLRQAYIGLFHLVSAVLFEKYIDFIDIYAEVREDERSQIHQELIEHKEYVMIRQMIQEEARRDGLQQGIIEGRQQGLQQGMQQGLQQGLQQAHIRLLSRQLAKKYQRPLEPIAGMLDGLRPEDFVELAEYMLDCDTYAEIQRWIQQRKQGNLS